MSHEDLMSQFQMLRKISCKHANGTMLSISQVCYGEDTPADEQDSVVAEAELFLQRLRDIGWSMTEFYSIAKHRPEPEPEHQNASGYHVRVQDCVSKLEAAGVKGAAMVSSTPAGWLRVVEAAADGIVARIEGEADAGVRIMQIKEKFGTLRFYVTATGSDAFRNDIQRIAQWADAASEERCMVTGKPGSPNSQGWIMTLCPEMQKLVREDRARFDGLVYPIAPQAAVPEL